MDYDEAVAKLAESGHITNDNTRRAAVARIQAEALVDIARSLSVISLEASFAMQREGLIEVNLDDGTISAPGEAEPNLIVVGDLAHPVGWPDKVVVVTKVGVDQGEAYADVGFTDEAREQRYYQRNLVRINPEQVPAEIRNTLVDAVRETTVVELETDEDFDATGEPSDDVDADFEPAEILEKLGKKKGKKS